MRRLALLFGTLATAFIGSTSAHAEVIWSGNFQTGDLSQWTKVQDAAANRLQVVTSPVATGEKYSLQVTVEPGDDVSGGARAEAVYTGDSPAEGDDRYYHWQTYFPADFDAADYWQIFTQWHQYITGGSPPLAIMVWGDQIKLGNENNDYFWTGPLQLGAWHDFIVHVTWSTSATVGGVEMWYDGQHVLPFTSTATLFPNDTVYLKQGLYRKDVISYAQTLYHWGMTIATELSDVMPAAADAGVSAADAGTTTTVADAGTTTADAGTTTPDAGTTSTADAGTPPPTATLPYSDTFASCTATSGLGSGWTTDGTWYCDGGYARDESAAGLALAQLSLPTDVTATARVQLTGVATGSGVVVRASASEFYLARILASGSLEIDRVNGSTITALASSAATIDASTFYTVGLKVSGTSPVQLSASLNGTTVTTATDSAAPIASGSAGLYGGTAARTQYDDFTITSP